jgi:hypothetical protein
MKKYVVLAVLAAVGLAFAQEQKMISFGVRAGLNLNSAKFVESGESRIQSLPYILDNNIGFHAGVVADIAINQFLYFQPGVMFSTKGGVINEESEYTSEYYYDYDKEVYATNVYCIELPLMLSLKAPLTEALFLRANVGPYFDFGLSGTFKTEDEHKSSSPGMGGSSREYKEDESEDIYPKDEKRMINGKAFNFGIGVGGGLEFQSFYIGVNYSYGITNVLDVKEDYFEAYDRTFSITLGYNF